MSELDAARKFDALDLLASAKILAEVSECPHALALKELICAALRTIEEIGYE